MRPGARRDRWGLALLAAIVLAEAIARIVHGTHDALAATWIAVELVAAAGLAYAALAAHPARAPSLAACTLALADAIANAVTIYSRHVIDRGSIFTVSIRLSAIGFSIALCAWQLGRVRRWH